MDLLRTILVYMSMVFVASVQSAPEPSLLPEVDVPTPTPYVETAATSTPAPTPTPTPVPTIDISPNPDYKTIKVGDNGEDVRAMQQKLAEYGYYTGEIDGRFGNQTRRAVEKFQYQHGLSVDGIAGKRTLTVLYDSDDIRRAPVDATPSPSPSQTPGSGTLLTAATSGAPSNTPEPTFAPDATESTPGTDATTVAAAREPAGSLPPEASAQPTQTVGPVHSPGTVQTAAPTDTPVPEFQPMEGYTVRLASSTAPVSRAAAEGEAPQPLPPYAYGETIYLPLFSILEDAGVNIITTDTVEMDEFAFALNSDIFRITCTQNLAGEPENLEVYKNNEPQILPVRDIRIAQGVLYLPAESIQSLTGIFFKVGETEKAVVVTMPATAAE